MKKIALILIAIFILLIVLPNVWLIYTVKRQNAEIKPLEQCFAGAMWSNVSFDSVHPNFLNITSAPNSGYYQGVAADTDAGRVAHTLNDCLVSRGTTINDIHLSEGTWYITGNTKSANIDATVKDNSKASVSFTFNRY